ncbi:hypothetical protein GUU_00687 [Malacoplasma iowae 695]|nr:hypothetical protein GUU_00687 [Malacoplasma iowae 695]
MTYWIHKQFNLFFKLGSKKYKQKIKIVFYINNNLFTSDKNINKLNVSHVEIIDNGIGFTDQRYNSFCTLYKSKEKKWIKHM